MQLLIRLGNLSRQMSSATGVIAISIRNKLQNALQAKHMEVINESYMHNVPQGAETHFKVVVVSDQFDGLALIKFENEANSVEDISLNKVHGSTSSAVLFAMFAMEMDCTICDTKIEPEVVQPRKKWCSINSQLQHDQVLHDLKCTREMIVIEREKNLLEFEKESHRLQIEKLKLEIDILTKKNS